MKTRDDSEYTATVQRVQISNEPLIVGSRIEFTSRDSMMEVTGWLTASEARRVAAMLDKQADKLDKINGKTVKK